jgi:hypothetical protein
MRFYNRDTEIAIMQENERQISLSELERKVKMLPSSAFGQYHLS